MKFNKHYELEGKHAYLSASKHSWLNYSDDKLLQSYKNHLAVERGTRLHALAAEHISLGLTMPRNHITINEYINDAIRFRMSPEVVLYYSQNCFGTADAIGFKNDLLRIHDLKTGTSKVYMEQLLIYAALFCLEYNVKPGEIKMETRIYQNDEIYCSNPTVEDIAPIMDKIIQFDKLINQSLEDDLL